VVASHNLSEPLFLYIAWQINHAPLQVPDRYLVPFAASPKAAIYRCL
jgi:hypothetical protein